MGGASRKRVWIVEWTRDGGSAVVHVSSSWAKAFDWVRRNFHPEREPPSQKNFILLIPVFVDREASGVIPVSAYRTPDGGLVFIDIETGRPTER
jgi:hypothetical protein